MEVLAELLSCTEWGINKTLKAKVVSVVEGKGNMYILPQHAVLSGHGTAAEPLRTLSEGDEITLFIGVEKKGGRAYKITAMVGGDRFI